MRTAANYSNQLFGWQTKDDNSVSFYDQAGVEVLNLGAAGQITFLALPASDPHVINQAWNSAGTLKVSAG